MNNFYPLIYLTKHLNHKCSGDKFQFSYTPHKDVWECYLGGDQGPLRVVFSANPSETALFTDRYKPAKKANVTTFFKELEGKKIKNFSLAENDRFITVHFENRLSLLFRAFGNNPNVFLVRDGMILESFKNSQKNTGKTAPEPRAPSETAALSDGLSPKRAIIQTDPKFPRHLTAAIIEQFQLETKQVSEIGDVVHKLTRSMLETPEYRVLNDGNLCLVPNRLLTLPNLKEFDNVNEAIRFVYYQTARERRLSARLRSIKPKIEKNLKKRQSILAQLQDADKGLERSKQYEEFGHILMAHAHQSLNSGQESVELQNFYDENKTIEIPVQPAKSIAENAQHYYEKSAKAIRSVDESKKRLRKVTGEYKLLSSLHKSLKEIDRVYEFDDWYEEHKEVLRDLGILSKTQKEEPLPYRKFSLGNYEIWVGKNAKSNDRVTGDSHKEDVWLHARGVSGSHVVIRMNNQKEMPPKQVILKAASVAAWNSKARGSELVPVIVTKRKYVTSPKGAPPGAVRVQRENVEMVKPEKLPV